MTARASWPRRFPGFGEYAPGLVLGIDPGRNAGYCLARVEPFEILSFSPGPAEWVVIEHPEIRRGPGGRIAPGGLLTLAFDAGFRAARIPCREVVAFRPQDWKPILYRGTLAKDVFCARVAVDLGLPGLTLDQLDAAALAWAFAKGAK